MSNYELLEVEEINTISEEPDAKVILFNDDWHTFDQVINQVIKACNYSIEQAEQIAMIVHFKGRAVVITASFDRCLEVAAVLQEISLLVDIEPIEAEKK